MATPISNQRAAWQLRILRCFLGLSALTWGVAWVGVFVSWQSASDLLGSLGAQPIECDPMLDYWLRMASGAFGLIGCWYLVLAIWPSRFAVAIPWFGGFMLIEGLVLLVHGIRLGLPVFPFYGDVSACFVAGTGVLCFSRSVSKHVQ